MIAFYISSHGFGHLTRCLVHIEKYLCESKDEIYIACGERQINFAKIYLIQYLNRISFKILITDIGLINKKNSLDIDKKTLEKELIKFIKSWDKVVEKETEYLKNKKIKKVIVDISPIGILVGKKLKVKVIGISNFTWYNQYSFLNLDQVILNKFNEVENLIDKFLVYPLNLNLSHINCIKKEIHYVSRKINYYKVNKLREKHKEIIFISCGKSVNLEKIKIKNYNGVIFYTSGIEIEGEGLHIKLPLNIKDTQNYIASSDFIISKAGWSTISEAVVSSIPMVLLERKGVLEDSYIINKLKKSKKAISINKKNLKELDIDMIRLLIEENIFYR